MKSFVNSIVIGDWSNDGHERKEIFWFSANYDRVPIIKAYKKAVEEIDVALDTSTPARINILNETDENQIAPGIQAILRQAGVDLEGVGSQISADSYYLFCEPEDVVRLFFRFVKTQLPDFQYELIEGPKPINGYHQKDFNVSLGYGCC